MNPIYIVDGYNLIHTVDQLSKHLEENLEKARVNLESLIRNYLSLKAVKVYLVYDGAKIGYVQSQPSTNLKIIFSKPPEKADPIIKKLIQQFSNKSRIFVVTLDRDILEFVKQEGALSLTTEEFYQRMIKREKAADWDKKYEGNLSQEEVDEWLDIFENHDPGHFD